MREVCWCIVCSRFCWRWLIVRLIIYCCIRCSSSPFAQCFLSPGLREWLLKDELEFLGRRTKSNLWVCLWGRLCDGRRREGVFWSWRIFFIIVSLLFKLLPFLICFIRLIIQAIFYSIFKGDYCCYSCFSHFLSQMLKDPFSIYSFKVAGFRLTLSHDDIGFGLILFHTFIWN
jgi:hypothetical protein